MSNVSIFEKKWLDLVFEGRNQKYGAYQLRRDSSKTTLFAFLFGIVFLGGGVLILSSFTKAPVIIPNDPPLVVVHFDGYHHPKDEPKPKTEQPKTNTSTVKPPVDNRNYKVAPESQAVVPISPNTENPIPNGPTNPNASGTGTPSTGPSTGGGTIVVAKAPDTGTHKTSELDRQPNFPGGLKGFYEYVGNHFDKQEVVEGETIRVLVSFVIEKNGAMTDIDVVQKTNPDVDKEAIRVLKSLKTKWEPGYKDGEAVRTRYTLPIVVAAE